MSSNDGPPSYSQATEDKSTYHATEEKSSHQATGEKSSHLAAPDVPSSSRRSMEDESRDLPEGWVRTFDPETHHQFFVDTTKEPPRSIWHHPYDDVEYLKELSPEERDKITKHHEHHANREPDHHDIMAMDTDEEDHDDGDLPPRPGKKTIGRKLKDKITGTTHEQRAKERQEKHKREEEAARRHAQIRAAMAKAEQTGEPQYIGKGKEGHDLYVEPSYGTGQQQTGTNGRTVNPYTSGVYANPNNRFIRPEQPYYRPYGYGYGGYGGYGYGYPYGYGYGGFGGYGLYGGLLGGALLGGLLF